MQRLTPSSAPPCPCCQRAPILSSGIAGHWYECPRCKVRLYAVATPSRALQVWEAVRRAMIVPVNVGEPLRAVGR